MKKIGELKFFPTRGVLKIIYQDGSEELLKDPKIDFIKIQKISEDVVKLFKDKIASRIFYLLLLRPYNKYMLAATYYGRWKNIPRVRIDFALKKLKEFHLIKRIPWSQELAEKFGISRKSKHIYEADTFELLKFILSEDSEIRAEFYLLVHLFKNFDLNEVYFEWGVLNLREENVDIIKLLKMKLYFLILLSLLIKSRSYKILGESMRSMSKNIPSISRKLIPLLQAYEPKPILDQLIRSMEEEVPEIVLNEINRMVIKFFGKRNESIYKVLLFLLILPEERVEELLEKLSFW